MYYLLRRKHPIDINVCEQRSDNQDASAFVIWKKTLHFPHIFLKFYKTIKLGQPNESLVWKREYIKDILI